MRPGERGARTLSEPVFERIARGDEDAVGECLDRFGGLVWSLARRFSSDPGDAEDAVQEIFVSLWRSAGRYDPAAGSEATFVAMIARRRLIDRLRRRGSRPESVPLDPERSATDPSARLEAALELSRVEKVLSELREDQRSVLELAVVSGFSHSQIAEQTGLALGTVKTHVRRGLIRIRAALADDESTGGES